MLSLGSVLAATTPTDVTGGALALVTLGYVLIGAGIGAANGLVVVLLRVPRSWQRSPPGPSSAASRSSYCPSRRRSSARVHGPGRRYGGWPDPEVAGRNRRLPSAVDSHQALRFGIRMYAIGSDARAARLSGARVGVLQVGIYALAGAIALFAGLLRAAHDGSGSPVIGEHLSSAGHRRHRHRRDGACRWSRRARAHGPWSHGAAARQPGTPVRRGGFKLHADRARNRADRGRADRVEAAMKTNRAQLRTIMTLAGGYACRARPDRGGKPPPPRFRFARQSQQSLESRRRARHRRRGANAHHPDRRIRPVDSSDHDRVRHVGHPDLVIRPAGDPVSDRGTGRKSGGRHLERARSWLLLDIPGHHDTRDGLDRGRRAAGSDAGNPGRRGPGSARWVREWTRASGFPVRW